MKYALAFIVFLSSCTNNTGERKLKSDSVIVVDKTPLIDPYRTTVKKTAAAVYSKPIVSDGILGEFSVKLYETKKTFHYLMRIRYAELRVQDTLKLPNFGMFPKLELRSYKEPNACIVGFFDAENNFKEYKLVQVKNDRLKIIALKHYAVATYRDETSKN